MAIINSITGYYGFTLDGTEGSSPVDKKGQVDRCIISIIYPPYKNDVTVTISDGPDDWGIKMGDDSIIPLRNPKILFTNRDNCIAQFDMDTLYPSNSPCSLVYRSDTAKISMKEESSSSGDFKVNSVSGHFAFTTNSFGASTNENGEVNKLMATIPFPYQISTVRVTISNGVNEWGARMGDGSIIPLRNPEVIRTNSENAIVKFDMDNFYPSNSPCILVYLSENASIGIEEIDDDNEFHPVTNIIDVPTKAIAGEVVDLNTAKVLPWNASIQKIDWTIVSGTGMIRDKHYLVTSKQGTITIRGTIENGMEGDDATNDFVKTFNVTVSSNAITIDANPAADMKMYVGKISGEISVVARSNSDHIKYQWHKCNNRNYGSSVKLEGSTQSTFKIPTSLGKGEYFYYCELTSEGAATVKSQCCRVYVDYEITSIRIVPRTDVLPYTGTRDLNIEHSPAEADPPRIVWRSSDSDKINVDVDGNVTANLLPGTITITAETVDGKHRDTLDLTINDFVSVTDIVSVMTSGDTDTNHVLTGNVIPATASYRTIIWSVVDAGGTGASISNGVLRAVNPGIVKVKATIEKGLTFNTAFTKEFFIAITKKFVPVTDITIEIPDNIRVGDIIRLDPNVIPVNSTNKNVLLSYKSGINAISENIVCFDRKGSVTVTATIINGIKNGNYTKDFIIECNQDKYIQTDNILMSFRHSNGDTDNIFNPSEYKTDSGYERFKLPYICIPDSATYKNPTVQIVNTYQQDMNLSANDDLLVDPIEEAKWSVTDKSPVNFEPGSQMIIINQSIFDPTKYYKVDLRFTIENGAGIGISFTKVISILIYEYPENVYSKDDAFVPLADLVLEFPSILRAYYPLILQYYGTPYNASVIDPDTKGIEATPVVRRSSLLGGANTLVFNPIKSHVDFPIELLPIFTLDMNYLYVFPWEEGSIDISLTVKNATVADVNNYDKYNPVLIDFTKKYSDVRFLPPYIPVKNVTNIPSEIPANQEYYLSGNIDTEGGTNYSDARWDEELSSYDDIEWSIPTGKSNTANATLTADGKFFASRNGIVTIRATIRSGIAEQLEWYGKTQESEDFSKDYKIDVINHDNILDIPICQLGIKNGGKVDITLGELSLICNDRSDDFVVKGYKKSDIISIKFFDSLIDDDYRRNHDIDSMPNVIAAVDSNMGIFGVSLKTNYSESEISWYQYDDNGNYITSNNNVGLLISAINVDGKLINGICSLIQADKDIAIPDHVNVGYASDKNNPIKVVRIYTRIPDSLSLKNFARNFTSLATITGNIPDIVSGDGCMENFLMGCTSFNQVIEIPSGVTGRQCLKYFMRGCTKFNKAITIPSGVTGEGCLHGFLYGCTSFNQVIEIPSGVTGRQCLERFLMGCTSFNQVIEIPSGVTGYACLRKFLMDCTSFNKSITLPNDVGSFNEIEDDGSTKYCVGRQLIDFMRNCNSMISTVTVPAATGANAEVNTLTFTSKVADSNLITNGLTLDGPGAEFLLVKLDDNYYPSSPDDMTKNPPYIHITNFDR